MLLFLDTEFTDLQSPDRDLISLGLVGEDGRCFYGELPPVDYQFGSSPWVRENVIPLLWGGAWVMDRLEIQKRLVPWIESIEDRAMIATDEPAFDWEFVKPLLYPWPRNLSHECMHFDSLCQGNNRQAAMLRIKERYFKDNNCPPHHALCDAQALKAMYEYAYEQGWRPK